MQALRQEGVRRAEGTSQLQDWNLECKDLESRRKTRGILKRKCRRMTCLF